MWKGEADVIAGFVETPSQVVGAAFPRQQLNTDNGTAGNPLQTMKVRYDDEKQRNPDPANRKHSIQSEHLRQGGRNGYDGGQNSADDPA